MFEIDHMGFFSVPHNIGGCLSGKKKCGSLNILEKPRKMRQTCDKLKSYRSFRVAGAQTLANFFLKLLKKTCLVIGLSDKTISNSI